jgi:hypothetical protein
MTRGRWLSAAGIAAALVGGAWLVDALVVSDEERLEELVAAVAGPVTAPRIASARERWIDLERQPFEVSALGRVALYRAGDDDALDERASEAARSLSGSHLRTITSGIAIDGDRAVVSMRVLDDRRGMGRLEWTLERHGDDWLLARLRVLR